MESVAARPLIPALGLPRRLDGHALAIWALTGALVLYLAFNGGGYDLIVRSQVGILIWWALLIGGVCGLLPARRLSRPGWVGLGLFAAFLGWSAVSWSSSLSPGRSLDEVSRVACYLGAFALALAIHRDREQAVRHTLTALAGAIVVVAALAVLSRLRPGTFAGAEQTASFLPGTRGRLAWPLDYWNALAALMAFGVPLLLALAGSAKRLLTQALAAAMVPLLALCAYLTFSRGGVLAMAGALLTYYAFTEERIQKLAGGLASAAASAVVIAGAVHRSAIENGLTGASAHHQGGQELLVLVLVCVAAGLMQVGVGLATRHGTLPAALRVSPRRARALTAGAIVALAVIALAAGAPHRLANAWQNFKRPTSASLHQDSLARFGSTSGNQRYDYWKVSLAQSGHHLLVGTGPGTWQFVWLPHATLAGGYVTDAHSLYLETLVEDGLIGLLLLAGFLLATTGAAMRLATRVRHEERVRAAGAAGACVAFMLSAAFDWIWQVPVLPIAFLLLGAAVLVPPGRLAAGRGGADRPAPASPRGESAATPRASAEAPAGRRAAVATRVAARAVAAAVAVACLIAIAVPLAATTALRQSQAAAAGGDTNTALADALSAVRVQPASGEDQLQLALVYELRRQLPQALAVVGRATSEDPDDWSTWLVRSRLEAETGHPQAAVAAFARARSLNPRSPVFAG